MRTNLRLALAIAALSWLGSIHALAVDVTGTWTWTMPNPRGAQEARARFVVKDGALSGTVEGRQGVTPIEHATLENETLSFQVARRSSNGERIVLKFKGTVAGDTITGTIERPPANEYDAPALLTWQATRVAQGSAPAP